MTRIARFAERRLIGAALLASLLYASATSAQNVTSTVRGVVLDPTQASVPGASTTLTDQATGRKWLSQTFADGTFTYPNVPAGAYSIRIEAQGFKVVEIRDIVVDAIEVRTLRNIVLEVGGVTETVSVRSEATVDAVQLGSAERAGLVKRGAVESIGPEGT